MEISTWTQIGRGVISVGSAAVELAERISGSELCRQANLIIGAGKMGEAFVRHLAGKGNRAGLTCNRSIECAQELRAESGGRAIELDVNVSDRKPEVDCAHAKRQARRFRDP